MQFHFTIPTDGPVSLTIKAEGARDTALLNMFTCDRAGAAITQQVDADGNVTLVAKPIPISPTAHVRG